MEIEVTALGKKLILLGVMLFLKGLFQGTLIPYFHNSRMALCAFGHCAKWHGDDSFCLIVFGLARGITSKA